MSTSHIGISVAMAGIPAVLSQLGVLQGALGSVAQVAGNLGGVLTAALGPLSEGGRLSDLSLRTGQTVRDLVVLERAFRNAGVGAEMLSSSSAMLQRALSGLNEDGQRTDRVFVRLGISAEALRRMNLREQMDALARAFAQIPEPTERAALAMQLFGRGGGTQMLQLLRDPEGIRRAADEVGSHAAQMERVAERFDAVADRLSIIRDRALEVAVAVTEGALPALESLGNMLQRLPAGQIGAFAGQFGPSLVALLAVKTAPHLQKMLTGVALAAFTHESISSGTAAAVGRGLNSLSGALARILPIGLAAAVTIDLTKGIYAAWRRARDQIFTEATDQFDKVMALRSRTEGITSEGDRAATVAEAVRLEEEIQAKLEKVRQKADKERQDAIMRQAGHGFAGLEPALDVSPEVRRAMDTYEGQLRQIRALRDMAEGDFAAVRIRAANEAHAAEQAALRTRLSLIDATYLVTEADRRWAEVQAAEGAHAVEYNAALEARIRAQDRLVGLLRAALPDLPDTSELTEETLKAQEAALKARAALAAAEALLAQLQSEPQLLDPVSVSAAQPGMMDGLLYGITDWLDQVGSAVEQVSWTISSSLHTAVQGISDGIYGWVTGTESFGMALFRIGDSVFRSFIQMIVEMGTKWLVTQALMRTGLISTDALQSGLIAKKVVEVNAAEAATLPAKTAGATAASISSFGIAAAIGVAAVLAAMAMFGGFAEGGFTGPGGRFDPAGIVHKGEYVFSAPAVGALGVDRLDSLHRQAVGQGGGAGPTAIAAAREDRPLNIAFFDDRSELRRWFESAEGDSFLLDAMRRHRRELI